MIENELVSKWISEAKKLLNPDDVVLIDGSKEQYQDICNQLLEAGVFKKVNPDFSPNSFWATSNPNDVARVEGRTYICSKSEKDSGPTNNWRDLNEMRGKLNSILKDSMKGRTMYVIPYLMGPSGNKNSKVGFELSDSAYVVANMFIMARVGQVALKHLEDFPQEYVKGIHSTCDINPDERYIAHFPDTLEIISVNTNYGGNALQGKKCFALRLASIQAKKEGWLAEHMLILAITNPKGEKNYIAAAFPSACGKTNLAMVIPPKEYSENGWKVETVGDDIAWLNFGEDGKLYAINPEFGFFGVASGTAEHTNPSALAALKKGNCIYTNTAFNPETNEPWWDELTDKAPEKLIDWKNREWTRESDERPDHPNARFTCPILNCPTLAPEYESGKGVPISAIIFGGRRKTTFPLVLKANSAIHGIYLGATMSSETTAAAIGSVGNVRRDPMAMRPFIGYHAADYFAHWLELAENHKDTFPKIFYVNWFRKSDDGKYLWPGFSENVRVLDWILSAVSSEDVGVETPLGVLPKECELNTNNLELSDSYLKQLLKIDKLEWEEELKLQEKFLLSFGEKLPKELKAEMDKLKQRVDAL